MDRNAWYECEAGAVSPGAPKTGLRSWRLCYDQDSRTKLVRPLAEEHHVSAASCIKIIAEDTAAEGRLIMPDSISSAACSQLASIRSVLMSCARSDHEETSPMLGSSRTC